MSTEEVEDKTEEEAEEGVEEVRRLMGCHKR